MIPAFLLALLAPLAAAQGTPVAPTDDGASVCGILYARPFRLDTPHEYPWMRGHEPVREGLLVVLEVDPEIARPRQVGSPVLYVGDTPVERVNAGRDEGRLVVIVPGSPDLSASPVYFGSTELPERVDAERGARELAAARALGIGPLDPGEIAEALALGGPPLRLAGSEALYHAAADLIERWAPEDQERADNLRAPRVRP